MSFPIGSLENQIQGLQYALGIWTNVCCELQARLEVLEQARIVRPMQVRAAWLDHQGDTVEQICAVAASVVSIDERLKKLEATVEELDTPRRLKERIDCVEDRLIALKECLHRSATVVTQQLWRPPDAVGLHSEPAIPNQQTRSSPAEVTGNLQPPFFP
jgi:hypothetical protein